MYYIINKKYGMKDSHDYFLLLNKTILIFQVSSVGLFISLYFGVTVFQTTMFV